MRDLTPAKAAALLVALVAIGCGDDGGSSGGAGSTAMAGANAADVGSGAGGGTSGASAGGTGGTSGASGSGIAGAEGTAGAAGAVGGPPEPGRCAPSEGPDAATLQASSEAVATVAATARSRILHEGYLYLTQSGVGLVRVPLGGGMVEVLIPNMDADARLLGFEEGFVYFKQTYDDPYARVPVDDWGATPEVQGGTPRGFANVVVGGYLYGHGGDAGPLEVWRQDFASGTVEVLTEVQEEVGGLDVADGYVYFTDNSFGVENLFRVPIAGGTAEQLSQGSHFGLHLVRAIGSKVYWADGYGMFVTDPSIADAMARTVTLGGYGPNPSAFGNGTRGCLELMARGDRIYWVDDGGNVGWTSNDRLECGAVLIQASGFPDEVMLGPDHAYVFGGIRGNELWRTPL